MKNIHVECLPDEYLVKKLGLPDSSDSLHDQINMKLSNFDRLLSTLIRKENSALKKLISFLTWRFSVIVRIFELKTLSFEEWLSFRNHNEL